MNLLRRLSLAASIIRKGAGGLNASWFNRAGDPGDSEKLQQPYANSIWVRSAIRKVSNPISAVPCSLAADPLPEVWTQWLRHPAYGLTWEDFIEASVGWLKLSGEIFWLIPDDAAIPFPDRRAAPFELIVAAPSAMRHVPNAEGQIAGWVYTDAKSRQWNLDTDQVIHLKQWNPYHPHRGLGDLEAAMIVAEGDYYASRFKRNLMSNNGDTGPYIVAKSGIVDDAQREAIIAQLREKRNAQQRGDFRPMFLTGDIAVEESQIRTVDVAFTAARVEDRHAIAIAFGVPPSMFEVKAAYSIGSASDHLQLIMDTCIPLSRKLESGLETVARLLTGIEQQAYFDWDEHPVMQEVRKERMTSLDILWNKGMPLSVVSEYLSLDLPPFEGWDIGYLPFSVAPAGDVAQPEVNPQFAEPDEETEEPQDDGETLADLAQEMRRANASHSHSHSAHQCSFPTEQELATRSDASLWRKIVADRRATLKAYASKFTRALMEARGEVLAKLAAQPSTLSRQPSTRAGALDFLFDLDQFTNRLTASFGSVTADALRIAGQQVFDEVKVADPWKTPDANVIQFLGQRQNKIKHAGQTVFDRIKSEIEEGINAGDTRDEIAARVKRAFNEIDDKRAKMIAQTETSAAHGYGRHLAIRSAGIERKKWVSSNNQNVRTAHRLINGYVTHVNSAFPVVNPKTGEVDMIQHPGDQTGAPWNVINCHCVEVATEDPLTEQPGQAEPSA